MTARRQFAEGTDVPAARSEAEIKAMLVKFGADSVITGNEGRKVFVLFRARDRFVKFTMQMPSADDSPERTESSRYKLKPEQREAWAESEARRRWRALALLVKAKLTGIADGIVTFEEEMLAHVVMPDGRPFIEEALPAIATSYKTGASPILRLTGPS